MSTTWRRPCAAVHGRRRGRLPRRAARPARRAVVARRPAGAGHATRCPRCAGRPRARCHPRRGRCATSCSSELPRTAGRQGRPGALLAVDTRSGLRAAPTRGRRAAPGPLSGGRSLTAVDPRSPVVVAARRTPGRRRRVARWPAWTPPALAAPVLAALAADAARPPARRPASRGSDRPDEVAARQLLRPRRGRRPGRRAGRRARCTTVPGVTVDRQCGSGLEAVRLAAALVASGAADGRARRRRREREHGAAAARCDPAQREPATPPRPYTRAPFAPAGFPDPEMGAAADALAAAARRSAATRQDAYAARSHARALAARERRSLRRRARRGGAARPRRAAAAGPRRAASLARLPAGVRPGGTATAGNSCGINDGAAAVAIVPERCAGGRRGAGAARRSPARSSASTRRCPASAPVPAVRAVLARAGRALAEVAVARAHRGVRRRRSSPAPTRSASTRSAPTPTGSARDGGAIALGHPWGASGAPARRPAVRAGWSAADGAAGDPRRRGLRDRRRPGHRRPRRAGRLIGAEPPAEGVDAPVRRAGRAARRRPRC